VTAWAFAGLALQWGNTLHRNGRWESSKVGLEYGILGAVSFLTTRTALHRGHLDLGVWHGYQEVVYAESIVLERLELRFRLARPGYLVVLHEKRDDGFLGVRLSRSPGLPSACLVGDAEGGFVGQMPLDAVGLDDDWHRVVISATSDRYRVELDGASIGTCGAPAGVPTRFGVRGSAAKKIYVDDVRATHALPRGEIREDFSNHRGEWRLRLAALAGVAAVQICVLTLGARRRREEGVSPHVAVIAAHGVLLLCIGLAWAVEALHLGRLHPERVDFGGYANPIEYEWAVTARLGATVPFGPPPAGVRRILVVGSSQTWGSGAPTEADTWVARVERALNEAAPPGERFELINGGIPGLDARVLVPLAIDQSLVWQPETVLVNLGNNDRDPAKLAAALEALVDLTEEIGIRIVFVPEPNTIENRGSLRKLEANHAVMRELATRRGIPVIEVHQPLVDRRDEGFVWWDRVHLTAFGQRLFAETLLASREKLLALAACDPQCERGDHPHGE
jgi:lysophospholipase L1-like esterase